MTNKIRWSFLIVVSLLGASAMSRATQGPKLWAVVGVSEPLVYANSNGSTHAVQINFGLVNDSQEVASTEPGSWRLFINGQDVTESSGLVGNGPGPSTGWGTLKPHEAFIFGKVFPPTKYFADPGTYEVTWKGSQFSAKPVIVRVLPPVR
jgi:hypothetical protein